MRASNFDQSSQLAAVFLDYQNLYNTLSGRVGSSVPPNEYIIDVLSELRRYLLDSDETRVVTSIAYADFASFEDDRIEIERELYSHGTQPQYVPGHAHSHTSELQLCVDVMEMLHQQEDISTYVLMSGDREFYPLVRQLSRYGRNAIVVALETPAPGTSVQADGDVYLDMMNLLDDKGRRTLLRNLRQDGEAYSAPEKQFSELENDISLETLEIAEEYFGQYEEIYLTPLLRKLSEVLGSKYDPKSIISDLEDAGAVRLEKREGYPYNYTVLIINENHPDVQEIHESYYSDSDSSAYQPSYDHDDYEQDGYDREFSTYEGDGEEADMTPRDRASKQRDGSHADSEVHFEEDRTADEFQREEATSYWGDKSRS